jgi:hypothetical protein
MELDKRCQHMSGEYKIVIVKNNDEKTLGSFETKSEAEKFGREIAKDTPRIKGLVCLLRQGDDSKRKEFYGVFN